VSARTRHSVGELGIGDDSPVGERSGFGPASRPRIPGTRHIRMLRLNQVLDLTGLGKTKIYALQKEGDFPKSVKITSYAVAWVEEEVQNWLARRIERSSQAIVR
jgi:prophage regulatory protein